MKHDSLDLQTPKTYKGIAAWIVKKIDCGELMPGQLVASSRQLAAELGVARGTVIRTYDKLVEQGYLEVVRGLGTRVSLRMACLAQRGGANLHFNPLSSSSLGSLVEKADADCIARQRECEFFAPVKASFLNKWLKLISLTANSSQNSLSIHEPFGSLALRQAIARYLVRSRGISCPIEQIVVADSPEQLLHLLAEFLVNQGDPVLLENPGRQIIRAAFELRGADVRLAGMSKQGILFETPDQTPFEPDPKLVYVSPSLHIPTGATMDLPQRLRFLQWAERKNVLVIEDDTDARFGGPLPTLYALDSNQRVITLGSFANILFPISAISYAVLPVSVAQCLGKSLATQPRYSRPEEHALAELLLAGDIDSLVRQLRDQCVNNRRQLISQLSQALGRKIWIDKHATARQICVRLTTEHSETESMQFFQAAGLQTISLSTFSDTCQPSSAGFLVGFAGGDIQRCTDNIRTALSSTREESEGPSYFPNQRPTFYVVQ